MEYEHPKMRNKFFKFLGDSVLEPLFYKLGLWYGCDDCDDCVNHWVYKVSGCKVCTQRKCGKILDAVIWK